jgi:hypothetical protein
MLNHLLRSLAVIIAGVVITGCATVNPMAFDKQTKTIDTKDKSILLMTVDISRSDESRFHPEPIVAKLEKVGAKTQEDRQNFKFAKGVDTVQENGRDVYLLRFALVAGEYKLLQVVGMARAFPIQAMFIVPLLSDVKVTPNSVTYVGRVTAKLRHRLEGEFRAGPVIPLIDQGVAGMSGGTWDVSIENFAEKDIGLFRAAFPVLANTTIETAALAPFDRAAAQQYWDSDFQAVGKPAEQVKTPAQAQASAQ